MGTLTTSLRVTSVTRHVALTMCACDWRVTLVILSCELTYPTHTPLHYWRISHCSNRMSPHSALQGQGARSEVVKTAEQWTTYCNTMTGTLAVDEWLLHLVQRGGAWAGMDPAQCPPRCTKYNSPPIDGQCTNFILFDVALLILNSKGLLYIVIGKEKPYSCFFYINCQEHWSIWIAISDKIAGKCWFQQLK